MRQVLGAGALGRPRGIGWRGRWEGRSGWGTHVNPWLIHVNVWQKPLQYCKVISLQLIKINGKKNIVLVSGIQQSDQLYIHTYIHTYIHMHTHIITFHILFYYGLLQDIECI